MLIAVHSLIFFYIAWVFYFAFGNAATNLVRFLQCSICLLWCAYVVQHLLPLFFAPSVCLLRPIIQLFYVLSSAFLSTLLGFQFQSGLLLPSAHIMAQIVLLAALNIQKSLRNRPERRILPFERAEGDAGVNVTMCAGFWLFFVCCCYVYLLR